MKDPHTPCHVFIQGGACTLKVSVASNSSLSIHLHANPLAEICLCLETSRCNIDLDV